MNKEEKLLKMFQEVYGDLGRNISSKVVVSEFDEDSVCVYKDETFCWGVTQSQLLFEYLTLGW